MALVKQEKSSVPEYQAIFTKLKKLHDIAKTNNNPESGEEYQSDDNKLAPKRKTDLDFHILSDDSTLNSTINKTKRRRFSDSRDYCPSDFYLDKYRSAGKDKRKYAITLSNLPENWTYNQIKQYVTDECKVNVLGMIDSRCKKSEYQLRLRFVDKEQYNNVLNKLKRKQSEGKLKVKVEGESDVESDDSDATVLVEKSEVKRELASCKSCPSEVDPEKALFGLNLEFLKSLNIEPPLVKWINVSNFRCDKSELRDLFEMAGRIIICVVINSINKYAKIMYSHPLEAVQAISLLNGQIFYGQALNVSLDPMAESSLPLPKGLQNFGLGLGQMGKPLRDIVEEYERFVNGEPSSINASLFSELEAIPGDSDRSSPSKPSGSSRRFGAIGPKILTADQQSNTTDPSITTRPSENYVPTQPSESLKDINQARSPVMVNPLANTSVNGTRSPSPVQKNIPMAIQNVIHSNPNGPLLERSRCLNPNVQIISRPNYGQLKPNFPVQYPPVPINYGSNYQGPPGPNFQGQPGPSFQVAPSRAQFGQENQVHFNSGNPQSHPSFRSQGPFMQSCSMLMPRNGPIPRMGGPIQGGPVQNAGPNFNPLPGPPSTGLSSGPGLPQDNKNLPPVMVLKGNDPFTLKVTNLPLQVTFANLCGKISKVGHVVSLEFTAPGSALVKFSNPVEADRCFQYNDSLRILLKKPRYYSASTMFAKAGIPDFFSVLRARAATNELVRMVALISTDNVLFKKWINVHKVQNKK